MQVRWRSRCQDLQDWVTNHDGALPNCHVQLPGGFWIGPWLNKQRKKLRESRLAADLVSKLDVAAPGWRIDVSVDPERVKTRSSPQRLDSEQAFMEGMNAVAAFVETHNRFPRGGSDSTEVRLALWIRSIKRRARQGSLSPQRVKLLDEMLPGWQRNAHRDEHEKRWSESLAELVAFVNEFGRLPKLLEGSGKWLKGQRAYLRKGAMREDREQALDAAVPEWRGCSKRPERAPVHETNVDAVSE